MNRTLMGFWKWANITPEEYAIKGIPLTSEKAPFNYPLYDKLITYAERLLQNKNLTEEELSDFLTIMALDNENEDVLDYAVAHATESQLEQILPYGMIFLQFEARWQLAELAYRRKPKGYLKYLQMLCDDNHSYVRKRARNCLECLESEKP